MQNSIIIIGLFFVLIGMLLLIIGSVIAGNSSDRIKGKAEYAIGGFIGPIPIGFFSSKKMFWTWLIIMVVIFGIWFLFKNL